MIGPLGSRPLGHRRSRAVPRREAGFTVIELLTVLVVMGVLAAMAVIRTSATVEQGRIARAIGDIRAIQAEVQGYLAAGNALPASLADIDRVGLLDPWGRPYVYVNFALSGPPRTDVFGIDLNTDFDVYSLGPDGATATSITAGVSQDDVVRGADGGFIGRASRY
jgi:general secretion pathway protein G